MSTRRRADPLPRPGGSTAPETFQTRPIRQEHNDWYCLSAIDETVRDGESFGCQQDGSFRFLFSLLDIFHERTWLDY